MRFASGWMLGLLGLIPVAYLFIWRQWKHRDATLAFSNTSLLDTCRPNARTRLGQYLPHVLRAGALILLIISLARPQAGQTSAEVHSKGVDIMLCLDTSGSMRAEDFTPKNRLAVAKEVAAEFIRGRRHDRIGVVVFGGLSFTQCPLTIDYGAVLDLLDHVEVGMTQTQNTAIGSGIGTCVNRLKETEAKSKIIILATDGRNNAGDIDPITAAKAAKALGIKIYAIGVGTVGDAMLPIQHPVFGKQYVRIREDLDEETLRTIASLTNGQYFRATSPGTLKKIFQQINRMEKTEFTLTEYTNYTDLYLPYLGTAFLILIMELVLSRTVLQRIP